MGIDLPPDPPELEDDVNYGVNYDFFPIDNCEGDAFPAFGVYTGARINAYYAAGGDCTLGNCLTPCNIIQAIRIIAIAEL